MAENDVSTAQDDTQAPTLGLAALIECLLFVAGRPLAVNELGRVLRRRPQRSAPPSRNWRRTTTGAA